MTLLEIYNKLLRRGCPEHPRLWWKPGARGGLDAFVLPLGPRDVLFPHCYVLDEADARAIITMHALEWWLTTKLAMSISARSPHWGIGFPPCATTGLDGSVNHAPTILEAIEAATRHLETK